MHQAKEEEELVKVPMESWAPRLEREWEQAAPSCASPPPGWGHSP